MSRKIAASLDKYCNRWCKREYVECDALKNWKLNIFKIIDISFYSHNTKMLPRKPKISYRYLKSDIQEFHRKYVLVPADKAANNVVVVLLLHYINILKQELGSTKAYEQTSENERSVTKNHIFHNGTSFAVSVHENQEKLPTFYWLPKLHKQPYKARFIANSSPCTTTELSNYLPLVLLLSNIMFTH